MGSARIPDNTANLINTNYQAPVAPLTTALPTNTESSSSPTSAVGSTKPTVNLFSTSNYQTKPQSVTLQDGSTITLPTMSPDDAAQMSSLFANIPADKQSAVNAAGSQLVAAILQHVATKGASAIAGHSVSKLDAAATADSSTGSSLLGSGSSTLVSGNSVLGSGGASTIITSSAAGVSNGPSVTATSIVGPSSQASAPVAAAGSAGYTVSQASPDVVGAINNAVATYASATGSSNYDTNVQAVSYMGIQGLQQELGQYATQMQGTINQQNTIRTDQSELSQAVADWPAGKATQTFTFHNVDSNGNMQTYTENLTETQAKAMSDTLTNTLSTLSASTQMQQEQLQNMEQNYQQGVTTISNIMNEQYQMVKNTVGNIHY